MGVLWSFEVSNPPTFNPPSSNKATPPNPFQTELPTGDQIQIYDYEGHSHSNHHRGSGRETQLAPRKTERQQPGPPAQTTWCLPTGH